MEVANPFNNTYRTSDDRWLIICVPDYDVYFRKMMGLFGREDVFEDEDINTIGNVLARKTQSKAIGIIGESMLSVLAPEQADRLHNVVEGDSEEQVAAFVENVRKALQR